MAFVFKFPETPTGTLGELWRALIGLLPQVEPRSVTLRNVQIETVETPVSHGLKTVPSFASPTAHNLQIVCQCKNPDDKYVYLRASAQCVADVKVFP
jgi:hypothetical protein